MDWRDDFGDLPEEEIDIDDWDFQPKRREVENFHREECQVAQVAFHVAESLEPQVLECLGVNAALHRSVAEHYDSTWDENAQVLHVEGGSIISGLLPSLRWLRENDLKKFRKIMEAHKEHLLEQAETMDLVEALSVWRLVRALHPSRDKISKREYIQGAGSTTLSKVRGLLRRVDYKSAVVFGAGNYAHRMSYIPRTRICVDTDSWCGPGERSFYLKGNLQDWHHFVRPGELIVSDCSTTDGEGQFIPKEYASIYSDMVARGHNVLFKGDCFDTKDGFCCVDYARYRPHNREVFFLVSPCVEKNIVRFDREQALEEIRDGNIVRMRHMAVGEYLLCKDRLTITRAEEEQIKSVSRSLYPEGVKNTSVLSMLNCPLRDTGKDWMTICMDEKYKPPDLDFDLKIDLEAPVVLMDIDKIGHDDERVLFSFWKRYDMAFDRRIGWVAVEKKN